MSLGEVCIALYSGNMVDVDCVCWGVVDGGIFGLGPGFLDNVVVVGNTWVEQVDKYLWSVLYIPDYYCNSQEVADSSMSGAVVANAHDMLDLGVRHNAAKLGLPGNVYHPHANYQYKCFWLWHYAVLVWKGALLVGLVHQA